MLARVLDEGESSKTVQVTNGVKQGCMLAHTHFNMVFSAMLKTTFHDDTDSMAIRYRTDGKLFNLRRLQARTKVKEEKVRHFMYADDCALNASSEDEMQRNMDTFLSTCGAFGFTISTAKTKPPHKLLRSNHHSQGPETANCRQVHIYRQYLVQKCAYRRRG